MHFFCALIQRHPNRLTITEQKRSAKSQDHCILNSTLRWNYLKILKTQIILSILKKLGVCWSMNGWYTAKKMELFHYLPGLANYNIKGADISFFDSWYVLLTLEWLFIFYARVSQNTSAVLLLTISNSLMSDVILLGYNPDSIWKFGRILSIGECDQETLWTRSSSPVVKNWDEASKHWLTLVVIATHQTFKLYMCWRWNELRNVSIGKGPKQMTNLSNPSLIINLQ